MAQVIQKTNALQTQLRQWCSRRNKALIIGGAAFAVGALLLAILRAVSSISFLPVTVGAPFMISAFGALVAAAIFQNKVSILSSGIRGEDALGQLVSALPDNYIGFQNTVVRFDGKSSEIDMIVVGPTGVFAVEAKNHNGRIVGDTASPRWQQHKIGQKGTPYTSELYSPVKQVGTHVYRLAGVLRQQGLPVYVQGAVLFSNQSTSVSVTGDLSKIPVFAASQGGESLLYRYIVSRSAVLTPQRVAQIAAFLTNIHNGE